MTPQKLHEAIRRALASPEALRWLDRAYPLDRFPDRSWTRGPCVQVARAIMALDHSTDGNGDLIQLWVGRHYGHVAYRKLLSLRYERGYLVARAVLFDGDGRFVPKDRSLPDDFQPDRWAYCKRAPATLMACFRRAARRTAK